ncbi:hypothetical protein GOODEAATRI_007942, partial [Goodea atripinnis]
LISDSFHMFFDCTALLAGLAASVISRWRSNDSFSYGYVRAEVLAGFVNGLFLIFTAFFIFSEGVESAPWSTLPQRITVNMRSVHTVLLRFSCGQLGADLPVPVGGPAVGEPHHSCPGDMRTSTSLEPPDVHHERLLPVSVAGLLVNLVGIFVFQHGGHGHSHGDGGVLLHIIADTLGSIGVIISALLMQKYELMIADPICSMLIAVLIGVR